VVAKIKWHCDELFPRYYFIVTKRWDKTSCHRFPANEARLKMGFLAYNLLHLILATGYTAPGLLARINPFSAVLRNTLRALPETQVPPAQAMLDGMFRMYQKPNLPTPAPQKR
jgi:hypothetical protein